MIIFKLKEQFVGKLGILTSDISKAERFADWNQTSRVFLRDIFSDQETFDAVECIEIQFCECCSSIELAETATGEVCSECDCYCCRNCIEDNDLERSLDFYGNNYAIICDGCAEIMADDEDIQHAHKIAWLKFNGQL